MDIPTSRKRQLRKELRQLRRSLSKQQQATAGRALRDRLLHHSRFQASRHIACYLPADGEIDTRPLIRAGLAAGKLMYLPVVEDRHIRFYPYAKGTRLYRSGFGLLQPRAEKEAMPNLDLDLVLMPLVGFDREGGRLGMGGGFYDRAFARSQKRAPRPFLLGVGHAVQELQSVPMQRWDRRLHAVATDRGYIAI